MPNNQNTPVKSPNVLGRVYEAEKRIDELEIRLAQAKKKMSSGVAIVVFVILALVVYHFVWVRPIAKAHDSLVETFNENVERHNSNLYR